MGVFIGIIVAAVLGALGLWVGTSRGRQEGLERGRQEGLELARTDGHSRVRLLVDALRRGRSLPGLDPGSPEAELQGALQEGWAPRETERAAALQDAVGRVSAFLQKSVRAPLTGISESATADELREAVGRALGAIEDLDFFIKEIPAGRQGTDLGALAQRVSREFVADQGVGVRLAMSDAGVRASVNPAALMDALYLVLHNAGRFGRGQTVDLGVAKEGARSKIVVRDRGQGFTDEALRRAFDPFYSTSEEGLGLGLPHARKVIEAMGGQIDLRNVAGGGAEVEISFQAN